jgi:uncharacterized membrane protein
LALAGCSYRIVVKDERIVRKDHYAIGIPAVGWRGMMRDNFYGRGTGFYTDEQIMFIHCPNHQGIAL